MAARHGRDPARAPGRHASGRILSQGRARGWDQATRQAFPSTEVTHLHLLRHGRVETGGRRCCYGHTDYPLSVAGQAESECLVGWVREWLPEADGILSSDLSRCTALARPLADALGLPLRIEPALREQDMGAWEGRSWSSLTEQDVAGVRAYWADYVDSAP
ncbi:MAG: histidine phosphatase family protein, partial [Myxococcota bacterium]|nr:histidine phosphatase family protein [Myxococcota bacterium]